MGKKYKNLVFALRFTNICAAIDVNKKIPSLADDVDGSTRLGFEKSFHFCVRV